MTKPKGKLKKRVGFECSLCLHLAGRRADLKKHLMRVHGLSEDEALEKQREARVAYEELTSVRYYPEKPDRYSMSAPGGE